MNGSVSLSRTFFLSVIAVYVSSGSLVHAFTEEELAQVTGFPVSEIRIKDFTHKANRDPDMLWAIDVKSDGGKYFRPFLIAIGKRGSFFGETKRSEFADFLADPANRSLTGQLKLIEFEGGFGVVGVPAFGPDGSIYSAIASLSDHDIDIKITLRVGADYPELVETDWNRQYLASSDGSFAVSSFLERVVFGLNSLEPFSA